jgi:hypothetical protein
VADVPSGLSLTPPQETYEKTKCPLIEPGVPTLLFHKPDIEYDISTRGNIVSNGRVSEDWEGSDSASSRCYLKFCLQGMRKTTIKPQSV